MNGHRTLVTCGEIHYPRSTRAMWPVLLERSKALGLNMVATYVFWNFHETSRGNYDFTGERDLGHYLDLCQQKGLSVFLRVGPYICAEWNYGGFPPYLRDEPGITIRTMNAAYTARVEAFFHKLAAVVRPHFASNGGPVVLVQVENEYTNVAKRYGGEGQEYLRWIVELAKRVGLTTVPTTTCEGGAQGVIETSNGFTIPPERIAAVRKSHPGTPLLWTELYPAWYRVWGGRNPMPRDVREIAGAILDFVSRGGSGWNYYPWHGGSNFGRNPMYLQTTSYDFSAPIDEYGGITQTGVYLGQFHAFMQEHSSIFLEGYSSDSLDGEHRTTTWTKGSDQLLLVRGTDPKDARLLNGKGETLFDLNAVHSKVEHSYSETNWTTVPGGDEASSWTMWKESLPGVRQDKGVVSIEPIEQLLLTKDMTDYCWYSTMLLVAKAGAQEIVIPYGGDFFYVFVDDALVASSKLPLHEDRGAITPDDPVHPRVVANVSEEHHESGFRHAFTIPSLPEGAHRLDLLAVAIGMVKGDWQIASPMNFERKGIWEGVLFNGKPLRNWTMRAGLIGERSVSAPTKDENIWRATGTPQPLQWYRKQLAVPASLLSGSAVFRIDGNGLGKGMIWLNGKAVGRHWLIDASNAPETPSQRYYHVPSDWLRQSNELILFEEHAVLPTEVRLQVRA
nr:beta-galactosidase [Edaphobacter lichenicola]